MIKPFTVRHQQGGFSFVESIVTAAIIMLVFGGIMAMVQGAIMMIAVNKTKTAALSMAEDRLEMIRAMPYLSIGTVAGVPAGSLPQNRTVEYNGIEFEERLLIQYIDDPADGVGGSDTNSIQSDYKQIKIEYTWEIKGQTKKIALVSNVVPIGIETTAGGGTIRVNVFDAIVQPVAGAEVRFINNSLTPAINTVRYTTAAGEAYLSGAPAGADYEIIVSKPGYTTDGTYMPDATVVTSTNPPVAVLDSQTTTANFSIDLFSSLNVYTLGDSVYGSYVDNFDNASGIATSTDISLSTGAVVLAGSPGSYSASGNFKIATITPASFEHWYDVKINKTEPGSTEVRMFVYYENAGSLQLVPDSDLAGNSAGYTTEYIDLRGLAAAAYPSLAIGFSFTTSNPLFTPEVSSLRLTYVESQSVLGNTPFTIRGQKTIGLDGSLMPVYKYDIATTTEALGVRDLYDLTWDLYTVAVGGGYTIKESCPSVPYALEPNDNVDLKLTLVSTPTFSARVMVVDDSGNPVPYATVRLRDGVYDETLETSLCGQVYFGSGLHSANTYTLDVSHPDFVSANLTDLTITGPDTLIPVTLLH